MSSQVNFSEDFKPSFSGHETFALRYGWLENHSKPLFLIVKIHLFQRTQLPSSVLAEIW